MQKPQRVALENDADNYDLSPVSSPVPTQTARRRSSLLAFGGGATRVRTPIKDSTENNVNIQQHSNLSAEEKAHPFGKSTSDVARRISTSSASDLTSRCISISNSLTAQSSCSGTRQSLGSIESVFLKPNDEENSDRPWCIEDFTLGRPLGKGKFGNVYMGKQKRTNSVIALKVLFKQPMQAAGCIHTLRREVEIQARLKHRNIARLFGYFHDPKNVYLILEFLSNGDLYKIAAKTGGCVAESQARVFLCEVASAVAYMHERHVYHRDIKPENILVGENSRLCIADFGWSVHVPPPQQAKRFTVCGTPEYLSPEMIAQSGHDHAVDLWAMGILLYELLIGRTPFLEKKRPCSENTEDMDAAQEEAQQRTFARIASHKAGSLDFPLPCNGGPAVSNKTKRDINALLHPVSAERTSAIHFLACG